MACGLERGRGAGGVLNELPNPFGRPPTLYAAYDCSEINESIHKSIERKERMVDEGADQSRRPEEDRREAGKGELHLDVRTT